MKKHKVVEDYPRWASPELDTPQFPNRSSIVTYLPATNGGNDEQIQ
jgi:hypothetical protein